jgi:hypothetical protein
LTAPSGIDGTAASTVRSRRSDRAGKRASTAPGPAEEKPSRWRRPSAAILLTVALVALFALLAGALAFLTPAQDGVELSIGELAALARERRVAEATFLDEDAQVVGVFLTEPGAGPALDEPLLLGLRADPAAAPEGRPEPVFCSCSGVCSQLRRCGLRRARWSRSS